MAYTPTVWKNGEFPPIDAEHLNKIEQGIANSAPGGFGLGSNIVYAPSNSDGQADANLIDATGFYLAIANAANSGWHYIFHMQYPADAALQFSSFVNDTTYQFRKKINGVWQHWEYLNPPMLNGVDYTTIDRYKGKPVAKKISEGFEMWTAEGVPIWVSAGKPICYTIEAGGTRNIALPLEATFLFSCSDNVRSGVAIVQSAGGAITSITSIVPLKDWGIEAGSGLTVNVTEKDTRFGMTVKIMML